MDKFREFEEPMKAEVSSPFAPPGEARKRFYAYLDQQLDQLDLELPEELHRDTMYFLRSGVRELGDQLEPLNQA
jgi:hypothetical protein